MKLLLSIVCTVMVLAGCATQTTPTEPGSGSGLTYVPMVAMQGVDKGRYDNDVAECRTAATRIAARSEANFDGMSYAFYLGLATWYTYGLATGVAVTGIGTSGVDFYGQPSTATLAEHQQIAIVHCMAQRGYRNLDTNVQDRFYGNAFTPIVNLSPRRTGVDTYNVENLAKAGRCNLQPRAELTGKGPGYEAYKVPCDNGGTWAVRCEFGKCRVLAQAPVRRS